MKTTAWLFILLFHSVSHGIRYFIRSIGKFDNSLRTIRGEVLHSFFLTMGPVYIKMGQIMSTRSDLFPPEMISCLQKLQDDVPPMSEVETQRLLGQAYPDQTAFKEFSVTPVASASIAQVHKAVLHTGEQVAVKIVKNGVKESLTVNLNLLALLTRLIDLIIPSTQQLQIPARLKDFRTLLLRQTDMLREADEMEHIRSNFENHPFLTIPKVFREHCTDKTLIMEFVTGIPGKLSKEVNLPAPQLAQRFVEVMMTMMYLHGSFHADAHPGNVLFTKDGKIILLDYGMTEKLSEDEKWDLASFYYAVTRKEWTIAVERYTRSFVVDRKTIDQEWYAYEKDMIQCLQVHFDSQKKWDTSQYTRDTIKILDKYQARESTKWTKIELALVSLEGFMVQIDPNLDIWESSRKFNERYSLYLSKKVKDLFDVHYSETIPGSLNLEKKAEKFLVAPTHIDRFCLPSSYPLFIKSARGSTLEDVDGNKYIELHGGYGPFILGYAHPAIEKAIQEALAQGPFCTLGNYPEMHHMELLVDAIPSAEKGVFCNSGTEACNIAMSLCRAYRKRDMVAKCEGHFHGFMDQGNVSMFRTHGPVDAPLPIHGSAGCSEQVTNNTLILQYGHPRSIERIREHADQLACVILEPIPTTTVAYNAEWLQAVRDVCTETGVPLIFDEVVSGFRVAYGGMQSILNIMPDLTVLAKIIGGGLPCGAVVGRKAIVDKAKSTKDPFRDWEEISFTGGTFSGNTMSCAAGGAQIQYLKEHPEIYTNLDIKTQWLANELKTITTKLGVACNVNGYRSMFTLSFRHNKAKYFRDKFAGSDIRANIALAYYMRQYHVYLAELHTYYISNAHTQEDLRKVAWAFEESLKLMVKEGIFAR